jgi:hypothetical protein
VFNNNNNNKEYPNDKLLLVRKVPVQRIPLQLLYREPDKT